MISIVMAYHNRKDQLNHTLQSISLSKVKDVEVILVDDDSTDYVLDVTSRFDFVKVITVTHSEKRYINPCMTYNRGIAKATGDIVIIQNPECLHVGDVLNYVLHNISESNYLSISTYALDLPNTKELQSVFGRVELKEWILGYPQTAFKNGLGWYNHPVHRPVYYHFCAAITKQNLDKLGGFDERFAMGYAYDDNELVERVTRLGLHKEIPTEVSVIHQYHSKQRPEAYRDLIRRNENLYSKIKKENIIKVPNRYAKG